MRSDLPAAIAAAIERCERPALVFDGARLAANLRAIGDAARAAGVTALFAAKAFPHAAVQALAAAQLDGFDVASPGEVAGVAPLAPRMLSIADPTGRARPPDGFRGRVIASCETVEQVRAAPPTAEIALRLSASLTGRDPAIGSVLDGSGHRRSRFGVDAGMREQLAELARAAAGRPLGLHVHHGPVTATTTERFLATALAALALAEAAGIAPRFLNLGGAWHGIADLAGTLRELRARLPDLELIIEPGRAVSDGAGFACGRIVAARALADRALAVADLSRICHLRWSQIELVGAPPHPGTGHPTLVAGPTCFEDDVLGEWHVEPGRLAVGARLVVRHVSGYAVAWNTGFGGLPPADVVIA